nr:hypothetical protein [Tanacetum cinerariifolium]
MASAVICLATGIKLNFSKYIFDIMVQNVESPSKFLMYSRFLQVIINNQVDDLTSHTTRYTSLILTQKVFANMRRVRKGFSRVETPLFASMLATASIKKANDVVKLQALIDEKKVVVTKDVIRQDLRLDDADGVKCFPNEEIFTELALMGYEKPPPKLTFYKACSMASAVICLAIVIINNQVDDLTSHTTRYTSPTLTQKAAEEKEEVKVPNAPTPPSPTTAPSPPPQDPIPIPHASPPTPTQEQPTEIIKLKKRVKKLEKKK